MRGRNPLQANDLLDIVDFIKNEEKYTQRINELKALEASLDEKMGIVRTLEQAHNINEKNLLIQQKLASDRKVLEQEIIDQKVILKKEHEERIAKVAKREVELRHIREELTLDQEDLKKQQYQLDQAYKKYGLDRTELDQRLHAIDKQEFNWQTKLAKLQQIMGSQ